MAKDAVQSGDDVPYAGGKKFLDGFQVEILYADNQFGSEFSTEMDVGDDDVNGADDGCEPDEPNSRAKEVEHPDEQGCLERVCDNGSRRR